MDAKVRLYNIFIEKSSIIFRIVKISSQMRQKRYDVAPGTALAGIAARAER
jgi:hypothetical protein